MSGRRLFAGCLMAIGIGLVVGLSSAAEARPEAVSVDLGYPAGSVVIINSERRVYYVTGPGQAIAYRVAVGKESERWTGRTFVSDKKVDPRWIPVDGEEPVEGGDPSNPLGQRALYLDWSLLRIHGTPSRGSIGSAVSNGCIRMLNEDVIDLFDRVHIGAPVFAINSRKEAGSFKTAKVADLVYVNPEARRDAKEEEEERRHAREEEDEDQPRNRGSASYRGGNGGYYYPPPRYRSQPAWPFGW